MSNLPKAKKGKVGRPFGTIEASTLDRMKVEKQVKQRILKNAMLITDRMLQLANGCSYLYRVDINGKTGKKRKPVLIEDKIEIAQYLGGELDGEYHFITTEKPDFKAMESMLDRVFGKATVKQELKIEGAIGHFGIGHDELSSLEGVREKKVIEVDSSDKNPTTALKLEKTSEKVKKTKNINDF